MGTGGVGGYFGGRLEQAGEEVWYVARGEHLAALRRDGLTVSSIRGDFELTPVHAVEDPAEAGVCDVALVTVKSWQTAEAAAALEPAVGAETTVLSLQNGATAAEDVGSVVGMEHMLGGVCRIIAFLDGPGRIAHRGMDPSVIVGELDGGRSERAQRVADAFAACRGVDATLSTDVRRDIWTKFLFIAPTSAVGAASRVSLDRLRAVPETRRLLEAAMHEVEAVADARGVTLAADAVASTLAFVDSLPAGATASMQRDLMDGRPSKLEAQTGALVRLGREAGVPTPANDVLYAVLAPQEARAREGMESVGGEERT